MSPQVTYLSPHVTFLSPQLTFFEPLSDLPGPNVLHVPPYVLPKPSTDHIGDPSDLNEAHSDLMHKFLLPSLNA